MNIPPSEYLSREERGEQDAVAIGAFHRRLQEDGLDSVLLDEITKQYAIHLFVFTREIAARAPAGVSK